MTDDLSIKNDDGMPKGTRGVARRTIVKGAAWSIPVIAVASAVPADAAASCHETIAIASITPPTFTSCSTATVTVTYTGTATALVLSATGPFVFANNTSTSTIPTSPTPITFTVKATGGGTGSITVTGTCGNVVVPVSSTASGPGVYYSDWGNNTAANRTLRYTLAGGARAVSVVRAPIYNVLALDAAGTVYSSLSQGPGVPQADNTALAVLSTPVPIALILPVPMATQIYFIGTDGKLYRSNKNGGQTGFLPATLVPGAENHGFSSSIDLSESDTTTLALVRDDGRVLAYRGVVGNGILAANTLTLLPALPGGATAIRALRGVDDGMIDVLASNGTIYRMSLASPPATWVVRTAPLPAGLTASDVVDVKSGSNVTWLLDSSGRLWRDSTPSQGWVQITVPGGATVTKLEIAEGQADPTILASDGAIYRPTTTLTTTTAVRWSEASNYVDVFAGVTYSFGMTADGQVWRINQGTTAGNDVRITHGGTPVVGLPGSFPENSADDGNAPAYIGGQAC